MLKMKKLEQHRFQVKKFDRRPALCHLGSQVPLLNPNRRFI